VNKTKVLSCSVTLLSTAATGALVSTQPPTKFVQNTDMRRLTTEMLSDKCVVRRFRRYANVIECTYTNLDSTV